MQNTIRMLVDLKKETYRFDQAQQGDDVILDITLLENGVAKDITGETVELIYINANNTVASVIGDKVVVTGNNIKITCPKDCTRSYGIAKFQLKIIGTYQVSTFPIALTIVPGVNQGQPVSQNISTILEDLTAKNIECKETLESLNAWVAAHGDITALDARVESLASQLEEKANKTYVDLQLGEKMNKTKGSSTDAFSDLFIDGIGSVKSELISVSYVAPTVLNGWTNLGGEYANIAYRKDAKGNVIFRGCLAGGTASTFFQLPAGYRPPKTICIPIAMVGADSSWTTAVLTITSIGTVYTRGIVGKTHSFDGVTFNTQFGTV